MSLSDLASLGSFVSGVAVLISLVFLYFQVRQVNAQVRQAERNQRAILQQGRAARATDTNFRMADTDITALVSRGALGDSGLTDNEYAQFMFVMQAVLTGFEDTFYQHQQGMLDDAPFESTIVQMRTWLASPGIRAYWMLSRERRDSSFRAFVDGLVEGTPIRRFGAQATEWKGLVADLGSHHV